MLVWSQAGFRASDEVSYCLWMLKPLSELAVYTVPPCPALYVGKEKKANERL